jgi:ligand-binding SRPBCC domain-containing protein
MFNSAQNRRQIVKLNTFQAEVWLPKKPEEVFMFFSEAQNLQALTPDWLDFEVLTPRPIEMRPGALIDYRLRLHGFPIRWRTEITTWEPPHRFVDEQKRGPYRVWHHEHRFEPRDGGTLASDLVRYAAPGGKLIDWLFVRRDVERIFAFRRKKLLELFGTAKP